MPNSNESKARDLKQIENSITKQIRTEGYETIQRNLNSSPGG